MAVIECERITGLTFEPQFSGAFECAFGSTISGTADVLLSNGETEGFGFDPHECEDECAAKAECMSFVYKGHSSHREGKTHTSNGDTHTHRGYCELWSKTGDTSDQSSVYHCVKNAVSAATATSMYYPEALAETYDNDGEITTTNAASPCLDSPETSFNTLDNQTLSCADLAAGGHCNHEQHGVKIQQECPASCGVCASMAGNRDDDGYGNNVTSEEVATTTAPATSNASSTDGHTTSDVRTTAVPSTNGDSKDDDDTGNDDREGVATTAAASTSDASSTAKPTTTFTTSSGFVASGAASTPSSEYFMVVFHFCCFVCSCAFTL